MATSTDWIVVVRSLDPTEAHLWRGCLEAAGLEAMVADAHLVQTHSLIGAALGGVRVMVPAPQAEVAREVLAQFHQGVFELRDDEVPPDGD